MFRKLSLIFAITALLLSLIVPVIAEDYGDFTLPRDNNGALVQDGTFAGCKCKVVLGVETVVKDGPGLVFGVSILGDAAGEYIKVADSDTVSNATSVIQVEQPDAYGRTVMFSPPIRCYDVITATSTDSSAVGFVYYR